MLIDEFQSLSHTDNPMEAVEEGLLYAGDDDASINDTWLLYWYSVTHNIGDMVTCMIE